MNAVNREILRLAIPSIVTNVTVPLLGWVDLMIAGHAPSLAPHPSSLIPSGGTGGGLEGAAEFIGAVTLGSMVFNVMYWLFGFLRMSTSGLTAQAFGARDSQRASQLLRQSLLVGGVVSLTLLLLQEPVRQAMFLLMRPSPEVAPMLSAYFHICIWGAPAVLAVYSMTGWFIGMQDTRSPMIVSISQNVINILCSLFFVVVMRMRIEGIALGTLIAQWSGLALAVWLKAKAPGLTQPLQKDGREENLGETESSSLMVSVFIFLRTICLVAVNLWFVAAGSRQGDDILAANALLMTFFTLFSYVLDGFAYAGEALSGRFYGAADRESLRRVVSRLYQWGLLMAALFTLVYLLAGQPLLRLFTGEAEVLQTAARYLPWAVLIPIAGFAAFIADGVCIGTTHTRLMFRATALATLVFFAVAQLPALFPSLSPPVEAGGGLRLPFGVRLGGGFNHFLWLALILYLLLRSIVLTTLWMRKNHK